MANDRLDVSYVELPAPQMEQTKQFYSRVFGWEWTDYGPSYVAYEGGAVEVGLNGAGAEDPVGPFVLISCEDVEAKQAEVVAAGGEIISAIYPYPGGRRFHFLDPSGNILGAYQPDPL